MSSSYRYTLCFVLIFPFLCVCVSDSNIGGPCRRWYRSCHYQDVSEEWMCTSVEQYIRYNARGCPSHLDDGSDQPISTIPPPPAGRCLAVSDTCQFSNSSLQCAFRQSQSDSCRYRCVEVNGTSWNNGNDGCGFSNVPPPDGLCVPTNGACREYSPCRYWKGFCSAPYRCGTVDDFYRFKFGPQPSCARPPNGFIAPKPPGECLLKNNSCSWSNCQSYLDFCRTYWMCGTAYDSAVYYAGTPPPCPAPPPGFTPPPPPGACVFNLTQRLCNFGEDSGAELSVHDACTTAGLRCSKPSFKCVSASSRFPSPYTICARQCAYNNGGCARNQICVERPFCANCNASNIMDGTCLNSGSVSCPDDVRLKCPAGTNQCAMNQRSGAFSCVGSCLKNNGGCSNSSVCVSVAAQSGCDPSSESCRYLTKCIPIKDLSEDSCPVGQEQSLSGRCSLGCEDYQSDEPSGSAGTCSGCVCPVGLVRYRDRCVDPQECYGLFTNPPPFNPLPLSDDEILVVMSVSTARAVFASRQREFVSSVQAYLDRTAHVTVNATLHGYTGDVPLQVALLLSGSGVRKSSASSLARLVQAGSGNLSFVIADVTVLDSPRISDDSGSGFSTAVLVIVFMVAATALVLAVVVTFCVIIRVRRRPRITKTRRASDEVAVMQSDVVVMDGQTEFKYSELYGSVDLMLEPLEEELQDDKKLPEEKKSPE